MVNERFLCNPSQQFLKDFNLSTHPRAMSLMNGETSVAFTIMVACLALEAIMKDQVEQMNTIRVAATAMGIDSKAEKNCKMRDCVQRSAHTARDIHTFPFLFLVY